MPRSPDLPSVALPTDKELVLKVVPMPADCNANGDIFGGWVMSQVDLAGCTLAMRLAGGRMATVAVKEFIFKHPVRVGDADQLLHGFDGADLVVGQYGGNQRGAFAGLAVELLFERVKVEVSLTVHGNVHDFEAEPFVQPLRRLCDGRVLDG